MRLNSKWIYNINNSFKKIKTKTIPILTSVLISASAGNAHTATPQIKTPDCTQISTQKLEVPTFYIRNPSINIYKGNLSSDSLTQIINLHYEGTKAAGHHNQYEKHGFDIVPGSFIKINDSSSGKDTTTDNRFRGTSVMIPNTSYAQFNIPHKANERVNIIGISNDRIINDYLAIALSSNENEPTFVLNPQELKNLGDLLGVNSENARGTVPLQIQLYCEGCTKPAAGNLLIDVEDVQTVRRLNVFANDLIQANKNLREDNAKIQDEKEQIESRVITPQIRKNQAGIIISSDNVDTPDKNVVFTQINVKGSQLIFDSFSADGPKRDRGYEGMLIVPSNKLIFYGAANNHAVAVDFGDVKKELGNEMNGLVGFSKTGNILVGASALYNHAWSDIPVTGSHSNKMLYSGRIGLDFYENKVPLVIQYLGDLDEKTLGSNLGAWFGKIDQNDLERLLVLNQLNSDIKMENFGLNANDYFVLGIQRKYNNRDIEYDGRSGNGNFDLTTGTLAFGNKKTDVYGIFNYDKDQLTYAPMRYYSELMQQWIEVKPGTIVNQNYWNSTIGVSQELGRNFSIMGNVNFDKDNIQRAAMGIAVRF